MAHYNLYKKFLFLFTGTRGLHTRGRFTTEIGGDCKS